MRPQSISHFSSRRLFGLAHGGEPAGDAGYGVRPYQVHVGQLGGELLGGGAVAAHIYRNSRERLGLEDRPAHPVELALVIHLGLGPQPAQDMNELVSAGVALVVRVGVAIHGELRRVGSGDHVDPHPTGKE